jgi:PDZ domain-containing protein
MRHVTPGRLVALGLVLFVAAFTLWAVPSSEYIFLPDPAHPLAPLVHVQGGRDPADGGGIYFVDVRYRKATLLERLLGGRLHEGADLKKPEVVNEPGLNETAQRRVDLAEMQLSQKVAAAVALRSLGKKVQTRQAGALISAVQPGFPAAGKIEPLDVIEAVDGKPVRTPGGLAHAMAGKRVGDAVSFRVRRGTKTTRVTLKTVRSPESGGAVVGIVIDQATQIQLPLRVTINLADVGGPSAGLAFALDVLEELGKNVDRGHRIAATGEMHLDGSVGPIGGVKQKTIGARRAGVDAFLVPAGDNAREARKYAHGLRIIPVKSFQQALRALATL